MSHMQPFENPISQEALIHYDNGSLEHVFTVQLTNNGNSTNVKALDMPLLIDLSSNENEMFMNASVTSVEDDLNNNPHATLNLQTNFIVANSVNVKEDNLSAHLALSDSRQHNALHETSISSHSTSVSEDNVSESLSEYLVFHSKRDTNADLIATFGCCVKLTRLSESEIHKLIKPVMCEGERAPKRRRLNSSYVPSAKKFQFRRESLPNSSRASRSSSRSALSYGETNKDRSLYEAVNEQPNVTYQINPRRSGKNLTILSSAKDMKHNQQFNTKNTTTTRVSRNSTKVTSKCTYPDNDGAAHPINQQSTDDRGTGQPKIIVLFVKDKNSGNYMCCRIPERCGIKKCSVSIDRPPTHRSTAPSNGKRQRECRPKDLSLAEEEILFITGIKEEKKINVEDLERVGLTSPLTDMNRFHSTPLASKTQTAATCPMTEIPRRILEECDFSNNTNKLVSPNEQKVVTNSLYDDIEALNFVMPNFEDSFEVLSIPKTNVFHANPLTTEKRNVITCTRSVSEESCPIVPHNLNKSFRPTEEKDKTSSIFDFDFTTTDFEDPQTLHRFVGGPNVDDFHSVLSLPETSGKNPLTSEEEENPGSFMEQTVSPVGNARESNGKETGEAETFTKEISSKSVADDDDDDDNCSTASDISLFASDSDTLYSPDRRKSLQPTDGWRLEKYRIPKKIGAVVQNKLEEEPKKIAAAVQKKSEEKPFTEQWNEQVQRILAMTIKKSPKMVSPISNPTVSGSKRKRKEFRNGRTLEPTSMKPKSAKPEKVIRTADKQTLQQPNAVESSATIPSKIGIQNGTFEEKSLETEKVAEPVDQSNDIRDNVMLDKNSMESEPEKMTKTAEQFNEFKDNVVLEENSTESKKSTETAKVQNNQQTTAAKSNGIDDAAEHPKVSSEKSLSDKFSKLNQPEHLTESKAPSENIVDATKKIDTSPPLNEAKFKPKFDFKNLAKITINVNDRNPTRFVSIPKPPVVTHSVSSLPATSVSCTMSVQSTTSQFQQPSTISSVPTPQPVDSVRNVITYSQAAPKPLHGIQSVTGQCSLSKPLIIEFVPTPTDSVQDVATHLQSRTIGMSLYTVQSTAPLIQPFAKQPLIAQPVPKAELIDSVQGHLNTEQPVDSASPEMRRRYFNATMNAPLIQPFAKQPLIAQPVPKAQLIDSVQGHLNTEQPVDSSSPEIRRRYFNATMNIFGRPCINFLAGSPCKVPGACQYNHQPLTSADSIFAKMRNIREDQIEFIYKDFIAKYQPTFGKYFQHMCRLFGLRKMDGMLVSSVRDCDRHGKYDFLKFVFGGLLMCDKTAIEAIEKMSDVVDIREDNQTAFSQAIYEIMTDPIKAYSQLNSELSEVNVKN